MKYVCSVCQEEAFHNEKLDVHYCKKHGFCVVPVFQEKATA